MYDVPLRLALTSIVLMALFNNTELAMIAIALDEEEEENRGKKCIKCNCILYPYTLHEINHTKQYSHELIQSTPRPPFCFRCSDVSDP